MPIPIQAIREAAARIAPRVHRTPVLSSRTLGERAGFGAPLLLKCESFQKTGSFKPRGALNVVLSLPPERLAKGLVTVSAGNHAQAVAWAARAAGVPCTVVMPAHAPRSKKDATRGYGATIVEHPDLATLFDRLREEEARTGAAFVHPFDDPAGLAGAGTVGLEIVEQVDDVACVVVPIGGGGLIGGIASAVKQLRPECRVVGVDLAEGPGMTPALAAGKPVPTPRPKTIADGMAAPFVGALPFEAASRYVDEIVMVSEAQIVDAMFTLFTRAKLVAEGAGAAATAAALAGRVSAPKSGSVVCVLSGGNVDPDRALGAFAGRETKQEAGA